MEILIKVENIKKSYKNKQSIVQALKGISFEVKKGDILGVLGPNGAGKSTLIKVLSTVVKSDSGSCIIDNCRSEEEIKYREKFSVALQNSSLELWLSVEENLKIFGMFYGLKGKLLKHKIDEMINLFELNDYRKIQATELSGGYRKRLQLAKIFLALL